MSPPPDALSTTLLANEELRTRNLALLAKNAQMEEAVLRMRSPSVDDLVPDPKPFAPRSQSPRPQREQQSAVSGTLWQFLEVALQGAARARAESRRAHAETLIQLDRSFQPRDDGRLKARALLAMAARASSKLQAAVQQLESEAGAALGAHNADAAAWAARLRQATTRQVAQAEAIGTTLRLELEDAERRHQAHARRLELENDRLELERAEERTVAKAEVKRLVDRLEELQSGSAGAASQAAQQQAALSADAKRLRHNMSGIEAELASEKDAHAADTQRYSALVAQLQQANATLREELAKITGELEQTRLELSGKLDRLHSEKEASAASLKAQLGQLKAAKDAEELSLRKQIERLKVEKQASTSALHERLHALQSDREADAAHLHSKIDRLKQVQTAALSAGSARGRALLYSESLKSPDLLQHSTLSWRGEDWQPARGSAGSASLQHVPLQYEYTGETED